MYDSSYHSKTYLRYHIIFSTKYRRKCLTEIRDYVLQSFKYVESISDFNIVGIIQIIGFHYKNRLYINYTNIFGFSFKYDAHF